ncbi:MAG TPA: hypothetical protein VMA98_01680 [Candidatus Acidoferrales bacterium]|nr:hypothetical protein [Candidatus Acidoferrales bacterium]
MIQGPSHPPTAGERAFLRSSAALLSVAVGVALCVKAGIPLLVPAAYLVGVFSLERQTSTLGYIFVLAGFIAVAIAIGFIWSSMAHVGYVHGLLVTCGLIFAALGRLRRPPPEVQ